MDLDTGKPFDLPGYQGAAPFPSPDGRWLLYTQRESTFDEKYHGYPGRLRLVSMRGGRDRLIPSSGRYLAPIHYVAWMPDSQGWMTLRCDVYEPIRLIRYWLKAPDAAKPLKIRGLPEYGDTVNGHWIAQMTPRGELALSDPQDWRALHFIDIARGKIRTVSLKALAQRLQREEFPPSRDEALLSADGKYLLAVVPDSNLSGSVWRFPIGGTPPQRLFSLDDQILSLHLAPDGKTLVYYSGRSAYLTTLPTLPRGAQF